MIFVYKILLSSIILANNLIRVLAFLTFDKSLTFDNSQDNSALSSFLKIITYSDDIQLAAVNFHENWGGFVPNCVQSEIRENSSRS